MKQMMQKERRTFRRVCLMGVLLSLVAGAFLLSAPTGDEKTAQCASFVLPTVGAEKTDLPSDYDKLQFAPGGMPFGVRFFTKGVLVVGVTDVIAESGSLSPAKDAGICSKDLICKINGKDVNTTDEVTSWIENSKGNTLLLTIERNGSEHQVRLSPVASKPDGVYRAGLWIRDSTAGIGTVTMLDKESGAFWGLGHGICDVETGELLPLLRANVSGVTISGIEKGRKGSPGELKGYFGNGACGKLRCNTEAGVSGEFVEMSIEAPEAPMHLARKEEIKEGKAYIYCTLDDNEVKKYEIEIKKIRTQDDHGKNMLIQITDPILLDKTGGIVQGMSGSPIIQNGKIIGAVTHVLVGDPTSGYGIFAENMIRNMQQGL